MPGAGDLVGTYLQAPGTSDLDLVLSLVTPGAVVNELNIIYDTVDVRPAFEAEVGHASWRP